MSSSIQDSDGYVFFSKNTVGTVGRPVKVHLSLVVHFINFVDPKSQEGMSIIRDIENLRSDPRANHPGALIPKPRPRNTSSGAAADKYNKHVTRVNSARTALCAISEYSMVSKNLRLFFYIEQKESDQYPTVYVSRIQSINRASNYLGGFYENRGSTNIKFTKVDECNLDNQICFVTRASTLEPKDALKSAKELLGQPNVTIFYNPIKVASEFVALKQNRLSTDTQESIKELEHNIKLNQKKSVSWILDGEGAAVMANALKNVPGTLETHSFKFTNARANLPQLIQDLSKKKANLSGEFISYYGDRVALLAIAHQNEKLIQQVSALPNSGGYENITRRYLVTQLSALGATSSITDATKGNKQTFIDKLEGIFKTSANWKKPK